MLAFKHSILSASAAYRWMRCPGSIRLASGIEAPESIHAREGTAAHILAGYCLERRHAARLYEGWFVGPSENSGDLLVETDPVETGEAPWSFEVTPEMAEAVQLYLDTVRDDLSEYPNASLSVEHRFDLSGFFPGMFGTNDACIAEPWGKLIVYDYKHGAGYPVEVEHNAQLMYYALGAYWGQDHDSVEMVIVQPRARHRDGPIRRVTISIDELREWAKYKLLPAAKATIRFDARLVSGDWCRFCPALPICPEFAKRTKEVVKSDFSPILPPDPDTLSPSDLAKVLDASELLKTWLSRVAEHALATMNAGQKIPGWKLVNKRSNRLWKRDQSVIDFFANEGLTEEIFERKLLSPSKIEALLKKEKIKLDFSELWEKPEGGLAIAPESDRRPAVEQGQLFEVIE